MNGTADLLRNTAKFLWKHPGVLIPVLVTRLLDFGTYWVCGALRLPVTKAVAPRSVLGGLSGRVNLPVLFAAYFFTFFPLLCEVVFLVYGMLVSGKWAHSMRDAEPMRDLEPKSGRDWRVPGGVVARTALITFCVGAVTAVVGLYLSVRGGVPLRWSYLVTWCFLIMAGWFILPSWLRELAHVEGVRMRDTSRVPPFVAMALGLAGFAVCVYAGVAIEHSLQLAHRVHGVLVPIAINFLAACLSVIPLGFSFVALSRYVAERPGWQTE